MKDPFNKHLLKKTIIFCPVTCLIFDSESWLSARNAAAVDILVFSVRFLFEFTFIHYIFAFGFSNFGFVAG